MEAALDEASPLLGEWTVNSIWAFLSNEGSEMEGGEVIKTHVPDGLFQTHFSPLAPVKGIGFQQGHFL